MLECIANVTIYFGKLYFYVIKTNVFANNALLPWRGMDNVCNLAEERF